MITKLPGVCIVFLVQLGASGCGEFVTPVAVTDRTQTSDPLGKTAERAGTNSGSSTHPILLSSQIIDFGIVPQGQQRRHYVEIKNAGKCFVEIERFEIGCDCVRALLGNPRLDCGEASMICLDLDLAAATEFIGQLVTEVVGIDREGKRVLALVVRADVRSTSLFSPFDETDEPMHREVPAPLPMIEQQL